MTNISLRKYRTFVRTLSEGTMYIVWNEQEFVSQCFDLKLNLEAVLL